MHSIKNPWIPRREVNICPWEPDFVRGDYSNPHASIQPSVYRFSRAQMKAYMKMMKQFGFTGVQLIDSCYSWTFFGSVEAFHEKLIFMAQAAREEGLSVSLWVWASFFSGHGWYDPDVAYAPAEGNTAYTDPAVRKTFEKYYDYYAELAPHIDLLIGHFFDPGCLGEYEDIISYMKLLANKFHARNPNVKLAVDTWGSPADYPQALARSGLNDYMLMEQPSPDAWPAGARAAFRETVKEHGFSVGMWGWYTCEYETDQMAAMYVNGHVLKDIYQKIKAEGDETLPCVYWSEMDAYHLLNIFSLYCSAQLLINPERDPDELLREAVCGIWSGSDADSMYFVLKTIENIRSGDKWDTYWWTKPDFRWGTGDNQADLADLEKACELMLPLMHKKDVSSVKISLPVQPWVLARLIFPHLEQMRLLAAFKRDMEDLEKDLSEGKSAAALYCSLKSILSPVPDFNTWTGNFTQIESREQYRIARDFCRRAGINLPVNPICLEKRRRRALEKAAVFQKGKEAPILFDASFISEGYCAYPQKEAIEVIESLERDGLIMCKGHGNYCLVNWRDYRFDFDIN